MFSTLRLFADFHNRDVKNRILLTNLQSFEDVLRIGSGLKNSSKVILYSEDLDGESNDEIEADARLFFEPYLNVWTAEVDWQSVRSTSSGHVVKIEKHYHGLVSSNNVSNKLEGDILVIHGGNNSVDSFWKASTTNLHLEGHVIGAPVYCTVTSDFTSIKNSLPYQNVTYASVGKIRVLGGDVKLIPASEGFFRAHITNISPQLASQIFSKETVTTPTRAHRILVDFNTNRGGEVSLMTLGSIKDIAKLGLQLHEGIALEIYQPDPSDTHPEDELTATAVAHYDARNREWTAVLKSEVILTSER
jgi:hypothetical protein